MISDHLLLKEGIVNKKLFHGSPYRFKQFSQRLTFFSETREFASNYASQKSMDYAMDREPNLYEVEVLEDIFDILDDNDFEKFKNKLPEKTKVKPHKFPYFNRLGQR